MILPEVEEEGLKNIGHLQFKPQRNPVSSIPNQKIDQQELNGQAVARGVSANV